MEIKIVGPSCVNCLKLELHVAQVLKELGREAEIIKVAEEKKISQFPETPPILLIDGQLVHAGLPLPARDRIMQWISQRG
jgi:thiol-disulfide isomerase/thioredoxin